VGAGPIAEGEGVGLIGSFGEVPYFEIVATRIQHEGIRSRIVMHPPSADPGPRMVPHACDVLPRQHARFSSLLGARRTPRSWSTGMAAGDGRLEIHGCPLTISGPGGRLIVERQGGQCPRNLRRSAFFHFDGLLALWRESADDLPGCVYPLVPELKHTSHEYDRLQQVCRRARDLSAGRRPSGAGSIRSL